MHEAETARGILLEKGRDRDKEFVLGEHVVGDDGARTSRSTDALGGGADEHHLVGRRAGELGDDMFEEVVSG
jgi:hypothetical protein